MSSTIFTLATQNVAKSSRAIVEVSPTWASVIRCMRVRSLDFKFITEVTDNRRGTWRPSTTLDQRYSNWLHKSMVFDEYVNVVSNSVTHFEFKVIHSFIFSRVSVWLLHSSHCVVSLLLGIIRQDPDVRLQSAVRECSRYVTRVVRKSWSYAGYTGCVSCMNDHDTERQSLH